MELITILLVLIFVAVVGGVIMIYRKIEDVEELVRIINDDVGEIKAQLEYTDRK